MDVAASYLSTKQMGPAGPTSEKATKQMKNAAIFVAKRTKNWAWEAREVQRVLSFFFPPPGLLLHHAWPLKQPLKHSKHKVVAVMSTQEMDGVRSFGASNSFVEDLPQPVEGNMQDTPESVRNSVIEPRVGMEMQAKNSNFYHALDLDDELRVRNVFWVDARSRAAYESFNDVITFDTTYLTNKYDMPFAPFIGINHHGESIILGCGLLSSEDTDSFVWVFRQWLQSMCDIAPKAIITDQCQAMRRAIEIVFSETVHRWCIWHITMKLPVKLAGLEAYQDIKHYLLKAVHDSMTVEEFEEKWNHTITSHHLEENEWLAKLYEERERWVPAFLNSNFFAGMSSTQRSESMNAFFDGYLHSSTTLKVFVEQFENAMRNKVEKEILSDFECFKGKLECSSSSPMEKQFQEAYTHEIFKRVYTRRWRKDIKRKHTYVSTCTDDVQHNPVLERYEKLHRLAVGVLEIGAESVENFNVLEKTEVVRSPMVVKRKGRPRMKRLKSSMELNLTEVVRSPMVVKRKGRPRMKRLKSSMEEAVSKPKKKMNTAAARNLAHSTSTTGVGGSAYGDGSTSNMSMSQTQAHGNEDQALNLT
uniref:Protein FAR1-RELATED SEQUENCE n=1 Tax=Fagus sylvatica TaxID=28930 RepID=A0A2N9EPF4_FAGSY